MKKQNTNYTLFNISSFIHKVTPSVILILFVKYYSYFLGILFHFRWCLLYFKQQKCFSFSFR